MLLSLTQLLTNNFEFEKEQLKPIERSEMQSDKNFLYQSKIRMSLINTVGHILSIVFAQAVHAVSYSEILMRWINYGYNNVVRNP